MTDTVSARQSELELERERVAVRYARLDALRAELAALPGITDVHDLHVWSVTSGQHSLTAHLVSPAPSPDVHALISTVATRHGIEHVTVQLEAPGAHDSTQTHLHP